MNAVQHSASCLVTACPNPQERALGDALRRRYQDTVAAVLMVTGHARLEDNNPTLR